jgi:twitching motility protein PilT
MAKIDAFFKVMKEAGSSDLHMTTGAPPMVRLHGEMQPIKYPPLTHEQNKSILYEIMTEYHRKTFEETHDLDFAYEVPAIKSRFRANVFMQRKGIGAVFRIIPTKILSVQQLGLPKSVLKLAQYNRGLVLVTGPTGSGKSTTLAALIDYINENRKDHILTIEDPIEFVHENKNCLVNQREVHRHTDSFASALRAALREDPDIILVGEMRDLETTALAIEAAETGHLVYGTLHTNSATKTVDRMINQFPADRQDQIRAMLSEGLKGVVSQNLLKTADGKGRCAAQEIMFVTPAVGNLIREEKTFQLPSIIQTNRQEGMQLMDQSLLDLVQIGKVAVDAAYFYAQDKKYFMEQVEELKRMGGIKNSKSKTRRRK